MVCVDIADICVDTVTVHANCTFLCLDITVWIQLLFVWM